MSDFFSPGDSERAERPRLLPGSVEVPVREEPANSSFADGLSVRELLAVLRRNLWLVMLGVVVTAAPVAYLVLTEPPTFSAKSVLRLVDTRRALTGGMESAVAEQVVGAQTDAILSQLEVLRGRVVLGEVVDREGLRLAPRTEGLTRGDFREVWVEPGVDADTLSVEFGEDGVRARSRSGTARAGYGVPVRLGGVRFAVESRPQEPEATLVVLPREEAIDSLLERLRATPRQRTDAVEVEFTAADPRTAQRVVNSVVAVFREFNADEAQQQSRRRRLFLEEQLRSTDSLLADAEMRLSSFRSREQLYSSREKFATQQQSLLTIEMQREELDADRRMYHSLLTELQRGEGAARSSTLRTLVSSPGMAANTVVSALYTQLVQYEGEREALTTGPLGSTADHPDVRRLDGLIRSTQAKLLDAVRSHVASLQARLDALDGLRARSAAEMQLLPHTEAEEGRLVQQFESIRKVSDRLRAELQNARMSEAVEAGQVEVVYPAPLPSEPIRNGRSWKLALGLLLGLVMGSAGALVREAMNTSIRRSEEMESALRVPGLATIPRISDGSSGRLLGSVRKLIGRGAQVKSNGTAGLPAPLRLDPSGAEAYRTLRTNLLFSRIASDLRSVVVTSSAPGEGKTTTAANLATAFAQQGMRVLLVDCDLRRPRLHEVFGVTREPGLTQLLLGKSPPRESIRETPVPRLHLLPGGTIPPNPSELLGSEAVRKLLDRFTGAYDLVILDTPPLLAASDAAILGAAADGVLVVVRAGQTDRAAAQHAMQQLAQVNARVVGAVLNDPDSTVRRHGGYYYYEYYSGERV